MPLLAIIDHVNRFEHRGTIAALPEIQRFRRVKASFELEWDVLERVEADIVFVWHVKVPLRSRVLIGAGAELRWMAHREEEELLLLA